MHKGPSDLEAKYFNEYCFAMLLKLGNQIIDVRGDLMEKYAKVACRRKSKDESIEGY